MYTSYHFHVLLSFGKNYMIYNFITIDSAKLCDLCVFVLLKIRKSNDNHFYHDCLLKFRHYNYIFSSNDFISDICLFTAHATLE